MFPRFIQGFRSHNVQCSLGKAAKAEVRAETLRIFHYRYLNQANNVQWVDVLSDPYRLECGITSLKYFNLYVNDLIMGLSSKDDKCRVHDVSYAYDMVLLSPTVRALEVLLPTCEEYVKSRGFT